MAGSVDTASRRETADDYVGVLHLEGDLRVAACRHGLQWLLQSRRPNSKPGGTEWNTVGYCQTRKALIRLYRAHGGADTAFGADLPEWIGRRAP